MLPVAALHAHCWRVSVTCRWPLGRERLRAAARLLGLQQHEGLHCWARAVVTVTVMGTLAADALGDSDAMGDDKEENMWWRETGTAAPLAARPGCCQCHWQHVRALFRRGESRTHSDSIPSSNTCRVQVLLTLLGHLESYDLLACHRHACSSNACGETRLQNLAFPACVARRM